MNKGIDKEDIVTIVDWEIHFCEGSYFMAKEKGTESGIIDNTFTEFIGEFKCNRLQIRNIISMLTTAYELQKKFPLEKK